MPPLEVEWQTTANLRDRNGYSWEIRFCPTSWCSSAPLRMNWWSTSRGSGVSATEVEPGREHCGVVFRHNLIKHKVLCRLLCFTRDCSAADFCPLHVIIFSKLWLHMSSRPSMDSALDQIFFCSTYSRTSGPSWTRKPTKMDRTTQKCGKHSKKRKQWRGWRHSLLMNLSGKTGQRWPYTPSLSWCSSSSGEL